MPEMEKTKKTSTLSWICKVAGRTKGLVILLAIIQVLRGALDVVKPLLIGRAVNRIMGEDRQGFIYDLCGFAILVICQIALMALYRFLNELTLAQMENRLKSGLFRSLLRGEYSQITLTHSEEWMNRLTSDTTVVSGAFVGTLPDIMGLLVRLIGALAAILLIEPKLAVFLVAIGLLLAILTRVFRKIMKNLHKRIQEADGRLRVFMQERLSGLLIIKSFMQEESALEHADTYMDEHKRARMKRNAYLNLFYSGYSVGINAIFVLGICFCGFGLLNGTLSCGNLVSVLLLLEQTQAPFASITGFLPRYYAMLASAERLMEVEKICEENIGNTEDYCKDLYDNRFTALGFENVDFTYPTLGKSENAKDCVEGISPTLKDFSFEISKGQQIAFTGPSGCGKSTVLKLLMNLYSPDCGEVYILSEDQRIPLTSELRGLFAYVPQGNRLFSGTIRETVSFGDEVRMMDEDGLQWALRVARAGEFVNELENGLDTILGEQGAGLSEGQMQRIAIARAVFSKHPILLLDEATSALDEDTAAKLLENIRTMTDKTVIMVTHRTENIGMFDKEIKFDIGEGDFGNEIVGSKEDPKCK